MFIVKETTANVNASFGYPNEQEAQSVCDSFNFNAANTWGNELDYVVEEVPTDDALKAYSF